MWGSSSLASKLIQLQSPLSSQSEFNLNSSIEALQFHSFVQSFFSFNEMTRSAVFKLARSATRHLSTPSSTITRSSVLRQSRHLILTQSSRYTSIQACRSFSATPTSSKGLSPESEDPRPKQAESNTTAAQPAELTIEEYHKLSDEYIDAVVSRMEQLQEERDDVDVEYSVTNSHPLSYTPCYLS